MRQPREGGMLTPNQRQARLGAILIWFSITVRCVDPSKTAHASARAVHLVGPERHLLCSAPFPYIGVVQKTFRRELLHGRLQQANS